MKKYILWLCVLFCCKHSLAHPMPSSIVNLSVLENYIKGEAQIPLLELASAVGDAGLSSINQPFFNSYFSDHIRASSNGNKWATRITNIHIITSSDSIIGSFQEAIVDFDLTPPDAKYLRSFTFDYDAVIHQVVTHSALIYVRQDWSNGLQGENMEQQIGVIGTDIRTGKIFPLQVNLEPGSWWKGFKSMFSLGMQHIMEGTDHLFFLIVLLLPAMLLVNNKQWSRYGGLRYSFSRLLKIVTAFTIGHSITLLFGALGWINVPGKPIEILIAISILVSAVHAIRPVFPGRETFIAVGFGLIHGLAFAAVLSNLQLNPGKLVLSILAFNAGIEIMQLFVIALIVPWLILLSTTTVYTLVRITLALLSAVAALAWIVERVTGKANFITTLSEIITVNGLGILAAVAMSSIIIYVTKVFTTKNTAAIL